MTSQSPASIFRCTTNLFTDSGYYQITAVLFHLKECILIKYKTVLLIIVRGLC